MKLMSLSRLLAHWAKQQPNKPAIFADGCKRSAISWAELDERTNKIARAFAEKGVKANDLVTITLPNSIEFIEACFAIWKLGATPQPISYQAPTVERDAIIALAQPSLVVGIDNQHGNVPSIDLLALDCSTYSGAELEARTARNIKAMTSGGSTGRPKLIVMPRPAEFDLDSQPFQLPKSSSVLVPGPLYHNGPFLYALYALCTGNTLTIVQRFDAERTLALIELHQVESLYQVPTMMQRIWGLDQSIREKYDLSSLKTLWHLAAACPVWLKQAFIEWLGPDVIWELYGGTEGQGNTVISGHEWLAHKGSVGRPFECEMKIIGDGGSELPADEVGEVYMRSFAQQSSYEYVGADANRIDGGWESLGDMGYMDSDGYLYLADRRTDMIVCGGANIYPAEVEAAIEAYPGVRSCAVISLPHKDLGNAVHAIVDAPNVELNEETLLAFLAEQLIRYKHPRTFEFVNEPLRDDAGKFRRKALREARL